MIKNKIALAKQLFNYAILSFLLMIAGITSFAQEKGLDVDIDVNKKSQWYEATWVWVVGGAVFILLLVALLRGGSTRKE
jgi:hypothetical protein